jgi:hypothetical protein
LNRFGDVFGVDVGGLRKVGNRARDAGDAIQGARRELALCAGVRQKPQRCIVECAICAHVICRYLCVSDAQNPNYRKSVDESISAVEAEVRDLTGNPKALLPEGLKALGDAIHSAQREAFIKLYGYTSDEGGIRHGTFGGASILFISDPHPYRAQAGRLRRTTVVD